MTFATRPLQGGLALGLLATLLLPAGASAATTAPVATAPTATEAPERPQRADRDAAADDGPDTDAGGSVSGRLQVAAAGGAISGKVVADAGGAPLADICVDAWDEWGNGDYADTAANGTWTITGLPRGSYWVEFHDCYDTGGYASEFYDNARWDTATLVAVGASGTVTGINASLALGGSISGTVTAEDDDAPLDQMCVDAWSDAGGYEYADTAADGTYTITGLAAGDYYVEFTDCYNFMGYEPEFHADATYETATLVPVVAEEDTGGIDAALALPASLEFVPVAPCAVFDTRNASGAFKGAFSKDQVVTFTVTGSVPTAQGGSGCVAPPADAVAVELNLVALEASGPGNLQVAPAGTVPQGGVVNFVRGLDNSNALSVEVDDAGRVDVTVKGGPVKLRGVVLGYYTEVDAVGLEFVPVAPCAVFDSRHGTGGFKGAFSKDQTVTYRVAGTVPGAQGGEGCAAPPTGAVGVQLNLVALDASGGGNLQVAPSGTTPQGGVVNFVPGISNSNALSVELDDDGDIDVTVKGGPVKLRGVVLGYYTAAEAVGLEFVPLSPCAVFDTRYSWEYWTGPLYADETVTFKVAGVPSYDQGGEACMAPPQRAAAIHLNLVALSPQGGGNLQVAPFGTPANGGVVNFAAGLNNSNALDVAITDLAVDVTVKGGPLDVRGVALGYRVPGD